MKCWNCLKTLDITEKLAFRATCDFCGSELHACINCRFYKVGMPNDCLIPNTEFVKDRERMNFCEEFQPKDPDSSTKNIDSIKDKFNSLFKE